MSKSFILKRSMSHNRTFFRRFINKLFVHAAGSSQRPTLMEPSLIFPQDIKIKENLSAIKMEVKSIIKARQLVEYQRIDPARSLEVSKRWKLYYAYFLHTVNPKAVIECPTLVNLVSNMPNVINASIAVLEPKVELAPHCGPHAGILRYHLGIQIPKNNPPSLRVKNDWYTWREGESVVLDDYYEHEVINQSNDIRVIVLIDFYRPMPLYLHCINKLSVWLDRRYSKHFIDNINKIKK